MNPTVLVAEDDPVQRLLLRRALEPLGVEVRLARHGREALDLALEAPPHLVLTDLHMPHMDGLELTRRLKALDPLLPVLLFTADRDHETRLRGLEAGADDFLNRPFDLTELRLRVKGHLERRRLQEKLEDLERALLALVRAVEAKDPYTAGHAERVARYALLGARELGAGEEELRDLHMGALLHDVGKIGLPDRILRGEAPLSAADWRLIQAHPVKGDEILTPLKAHPPPPSLCALAPREAGRLRLPRRPHGDPPPGPGPERRRHVRRPHQPQDLPGGRKARGSPGGPGAGGPGGEARPRRRCGPCGRASGAGPQRPKDTYFTSRYSKRPHFPLPGRAPSASRRQRGPAGWRARRRSPPRCRTPGPPPPGRPGRGPG